MPLTSGGPHLNSRHEADTERPDSQSNQEPKPTAACHDLSIFPWLRKLDLRVIGRDFGLQISAENSVRSSSGEALVRG